MAVNEDLIKVNKGDEVKIVKSGNKVYLETLDGDRLSGATTSGFTGRKNRKQFVFRDEDAARYYLDLRGYFPEGEKPDEDVDTDVDTDVDSDTRLEGADEVVERDIIEETQIDLGDTEEAEAAEEALAEVGQAGAAAFGGSKVGDVTQGTESFTDEEELEEQVQVTQEEIDTALEEENDIVDDVVATSGTSILTSVPAAAQTISSGTALGGQQEQAAAISVGPAEDEAVEMYTRGRRATIATRPGGLLTPTEEMDDPRFRRRRSFLAG